MENMEKSLALLKQELRKPAKFQKTPEIIKLIRVSLGYTQQDFGVFLGTQSTTVSRWETGKNQPIFTQDQVNLLDYELKKLGVDLFDFEGFDIKLKPHQYKFIKSHALAMA
ncbi:hypothetical protein GM3709_2330 [Geminocystis sp. NIES-3709]|nr:hypothetical protein GM3709_2330 [Geminocystis sp. NIES-3709]